MIQLPKKQNSYTPTCYLCIQESGNIDSYGFRKSHSIKKDFFLYITGFVYDNSMKAVSDYDLLYSLKKGIHNLLHFQGDFAGVFINGKNVYVFSDRMCIRKIYYAFHKNNLYVSTKIDTLASETGNYNIAPEAIAQLFFERSLISHTTWFCGIRTLQIGEYALCRMEQKDITEISYDPSFLKVSQDLSVEQYGKILANALEQSITDIYCHLKPKNCAFTLSAGWDSRLIAAVLKQNGISMPALVVETDQGYDEVSFTREINDSYFHFPLTTIHQPENYFEHSIDSCIEAFEYSMCEHNWFEEALIPAGNMNRTFITGLAASNMLRVRCDQDAKLSAFYSNKSDDAKIADYCAAKAKPIPFFTPDFQEYLNTGYSTTIAKEMLPFIHSQTGGYAWYNMTRTSNQILRIVNLMRPHFNSVHPFCSNKFLNISLCLPADIQGPELYRQIFMNIDPKAWDIPSSNTAPEYKKEHPVPIKKIKPATMDHLFDTVKNGLMQQNGILNIDLFNKYVENNKNKLSNTWRLLVLFYTYEKRLQKIAELKKQ